jgi:hypothetical protein
MTNMIEHLPRIVLPDGTVIMPCQIDEIIISTNRCRAKLDGIYRNYDTSRCRLDRQSPFSDKNWVRIFENDRVEATALCGVIQFDIEFGVWILHTMDTHKRRWSLSAITTEVVITGMLPYKED